MNVECFLKENMNAMFAFFGINHIDNNTETKWQKQPQTVKQIKHRSHDAHSYGVFIVGVVSVDVIFNI